MRTPTRLDKLLFVAALPVLASCTAADPAPAPKTPESPPARPAAGSSADAAPAAAPAASSAPAASPARRAALRFDLDGDDFPSPLVDVIVSGQPTTMIVDTGATHQVVASWVAEQVGPTKASAGDVGLDHAGKTLSLARLPDAKIAVSGWGPIDASNAVVVALPDVLKRRGIGGVLSPHALAAEGRAVVLDLRKGTMTDAPLDDAVRALDAEPGERVDGEVKSCGPGGGALPYVRATVGGTAVEAQIDTGATQTTVRAGSEAAKGLAGRAKGASSAVVASGTVSAATAEGTRVKLGALEVETDVALVPKTARPACPNDAQLGMDVLRRCVLVLGTSSLAGKCSGPAGR